MTVPIMALDLRKCKDKSIMNMTIPCGQVFPVSGIGNLLISSTPSGATIFIDGIEQTNKTPTTITGLSSGDRNVLIRLNNYKDYSTISTILENQTSTIDAILIPDEGCIEFRTIPSGAGIYIDDILQSEIAPTIICGLGLGIHTYKLTLSGYVDATGSVNLVSDHGELVFVNMHPIVVAAGFGLGQMLLIGGIALGALYLYLSRRKCPYPQPTQLPRIPPEMIITPTAEYVKDITELEASER